MDTSIVERRAVEAVSAICHRDSLYRLESKIPIGDRGIAFDGEIEVYKDDKRTKSSFLYKVPVQVKGTSVTAFNKDHIFYNRLTYEELNIYLKSNGVLFFYVQVDKENRLENKVFCRILLPIDICKILEKKQKTYTIKCNGLAYDSKETLYNYCSFFKENSDKQAQIQNISYVQNFSMESFMSEPQTLSISAIGNFESLYDLLFSNKKYVYLNDNGIDRLIPTWSVEEISSEDIREYEYEGLINRISCEERVSKNHKEMIFENMLFVKEDKSENVTVTLKTNSSSLVEKKRMLNFLNFLHSEAIEEEALNQYHRMICFLEDIIIMHETIYDFFNLPYSLSVFIKDGDQSGQKLFQILNTPNEFFNQVKNDGFYSFSFGNIKLLAYVEKTNKKIKDAFCNDVAFQDALLTLEKKNEGDSLSCVTSIYLVLLNSIPLDNIVHENLDSLKIIESFKRSINLKDFDFSLIINQVVLRCLDKYDVSKNKIFLNIADYLMTEIQEAYPEDLKFLLNKAQIEKRRNEITEHTFEKLVKARIEQDLDDELNLAFNIIFEEHKMAKARFKRLSSKKKKEFEKYPIYKLFQR